MQIELREILIPFRFRYGHALKKHVGVSTIVCSARDESGNVGLGEAVPRDYVTGETCESVLSDAPRLWSQLKTDSASTADEFASLARSRVELAQDWANDFPSCALAAIDTALCDLWSQQAEKPMWEMLGGTNDSPCDYAASIGISGKFKLAALLWLYRRLGFRKFKAKVGDDADTERVRYIRSKLGADAEIYVDANAAWTREQAVRKIESFAELGAWAIEEPLKQPDTQVDASGRQHRLASLTDKHYSDYAWLRERVELPLIADESLICWRSLDRIIAGKAFDVLNIRLSKCGGPMLSTQMAMRGIAAGLSIGVGAMVGETPILATAGTHFAAAFPQRRFVQGHSHGLLHGKRFVTGEPTMRKARISPNSDKPGLGLHLDERKLDQLTVRAVRIE